MSDEWWDSVGLKKPTYGKTKEEEVSDSGIERVIELIGVHGRGQYVNSVCLVATPRTNGSDLHSLIERINGGEVDGAERAKGRWFYEGEKCDEDIVIFDMASLNAEEAIKFIEAKKWDGQIVLVHFFDSHYSSPKTTLYGNVFDREGLIAWMKMRETDLFARPIGGETGAVNFSSPVEGNPWDRILRDPPSINIPSDDDPPKNPLLRAGFSLLMRSDDDSFETYVNDSIGVVTVDLEEGEGRVFMRSGKQGIVNGCEEEIYNLLAKEVNTLSDSLSSKDIETVLPLAEGVLGTASLQFDSDRFSGVASWRTDRGRVTLRKTVFATRYELKVELLVKLYDMKTPDWFTIEKGYYTVSGAINEATMALKEFFVPNMIARIQRRVNEMYSQQVLASNFCKIYDAIEEVIEKLKE